MSFQSECERLAAAAQGVVEEFDRVIFALPENYFLDLLFLQRSAEHVKDRLEALGDSDLPEERLAKRLKCFQKVTGNLQIALSTARGLVYTKGEPDLLPYVEGGRGGGTELDGCLAAH